MIYFLFFFNDTATTEIYTLSLHDALPILEDAPTVILQGHLDMVCEKNKGVEHDFNKDPLKLKVEGDMLYATDRSEEHTSELQSRQYLVCRLLLEKKKKKKYNQNLTRSRNT